MSKYPVETSDLDGVIAGVNYLLSGPAGLGQNFSGESYDTLGTLTGNFYSPYIVPFSEPSPILFVAPIYISTQTKLDNYTYKFTFASIQTDPPFKLGNRISVGPDYNFPNFGNTFDTIGVIECTTEYVIAKFSTPVDLPDIDSTYQVWMTLTTIFSPGLTSVNYWIPVGCEAVTTVNSATDRVFLSSQLEVGLLTIFSSLSVDIAVDMYVAINRYVIINTPDGENTNVSYSFDKTIVQKIKNIVVPAGEFYAMDPQDFIFTSFIDQPNLGHYLYSLEIYMYANAPSDQSLELQVIQVGLRTLTAQVVKQ